MAKGIALVLEDYCSYCKDFDADVIKMFYRCADGTEESIINIKCVNASRCERIISHLKQESDKPSKQ